MLRCSPTVLQKRAVYKQRRQLRVRGFAQMSTLLNNYYLVKVSIKWERVKKYPKFCLRGLYTVQKWIFNTTLPKIIYQAN